MVKGKNTLAVKMTIALVAGIAAGFLCILLRENVGAQSETWKMINKFLFQDISAKGAEKMTIALVAGIAAGFLCILLRENVGAQSETWKMINKFLFQDISAKGAEKAVGIFYIIGQLFINSLQLIIIPFTSAYNYSNGIYINNSCNVSYKRL